MVSGKIKNTKCAHSNCSFNFFFFLCFLLIRLLLCTCGDIIDFFPDFYCISVVLDQKQTFFITLVFRLNILVVFTATISGSSFRVSIILQQARFNFSRLRECLVCFEDCQQRGQFAFYNSPKAYQFCGVSYIYQNKCLSFKQRRLSIMSIERHNSVGLLKLNRKAPGVYWIIHFRAAHNRESFFIKARPRKQSFT